MSMKKMFYGYPLIAALGVMYFCSSGAILPAANVINPLMLEDQSMGLNGTLLGAGFSLFVLFQGISAPIIGSIIERKGARSAMVIGASVFLAASCCMAFLASAPWMYFICFGVFASIGAMMAGQLSVQSTVGEWFIERRGVAMTVTMIIGASSAFLLPSVVEWVIGAFGGSWRSGWYLMIALGIVMIPTALFFMRNRPADIGQLPDGASSTQDMATRRRAFKVYKAEKSTPFSQVVRMVSFWLVALTATAGFAAYTFATSQGVIHFTTMGIERSAVVVGVSLMGGAGLIGKVTMGFISDRVEPIRIMSIAAILLTVGLLIAASTSNPVAMYAFYFLTGFGFGAITATFPTAIANYFGAGSLSKNLGFGILVTTLVASTLPVISGIIYDAVGSCSPAFFLVAFITAICALCGFLFRLPTKDDRVAKEHRG